MAAQLIKCQIESCIYNAPDHRCTLNSITVSPCAPMDSDGVAYRSDSMCANFVKKESGLF